MRVTVYKGLENLKQELQVKYIGSRWISPIFTIALIGFLGWVRRVMGQMIAPQG